MEEVAGRVTPPQLYLHSASALSRNLEAPGNKGLSKYWLRKISLSNQDKVEIGKSSLSAIVKKLC
jgi:hypothetical protein